MRKTYEELNKIKQKYNVSELWSFSKFDTYRTSQFEWMLKYLQKKPENNEKKSAYGSLGSAAHQCLEDYYNDKIKANEMFEQFESAFMVNIDIAGLYFDRCDSIKNDNIKNKYYDDLKHFFANFKPSPYKSLMEQFVVIKVTDDIVFQGYSDCTHKEEDGVIVITDFKTSTMYSGKAILEHAAQLVLYSEALRQLGVPQDKIKARWHFLKYVTVECEQINGKIKERNIERREIGDKLQASIKSWMKKLKYDDDLIFAALDQVVQTNDIECLPDDVKSKYVIKDCYVYVDDIWSLYDDLKEEIIKIIAEIREKTKQYNELKEVDMDAAEHLFWDDDESLKAQSYYYNNLCGYNIPTIKPFFEYIQKTIQNKNIQNNEEIEDLSWLEGL